MPATALVHQLANYIGQAKSDNTRRAYASDWKQFTNWCRHQQHQFLPAAPETVALYAAAMAETSKTSTITRRMSAISQAHQLAGFSPPTSDYGVRTVLSGIRRAKGTAPEAKKPLLVDDLKTVLERLPGSRIGARDRALLAVGFGGAFRRSELVALNWDDIDWGREGLTINIRRSKTDQEGQGRKVGIPYAREAAHCPVRLLQAWLETEPASDGPVFVPIDRHGNAATHRLSGKGVARIVKRALSAAGYDARQYSGHSLRAGLATAAALGGASERAIMNQTGHRSVTMVRRYIRDGSLFQDNAMARTGL